jgi:hypothetical protein
VFNAGHECRLGTDQAAELIGDRGEHLARQLTQLRPAGWVMARSRIGGMVRLGADVSADGLPVRFRWDV